MGVPRLDVSCALNTWRERYWNPLRKRCLEKRDVTCLILRYVSPLVSYFCVPCTICSQPSVSPTAGLPVWMPGTGFLSSAMTPRQWAVGFWRSEATWCHLRVSIGPWTILGPRVLSLKNRSCLLQKWPTRCNCVG